MKIKLKIPSLIFLIMVFCTIGNSRYFTEIGINIYFEYLGLALLLMEIYSYTLLRIHIYWKHYAFLLTVLLLFCIGFFKQNLERSTVISLCLSMFILASIAILPYGLRKNNACFRGIGTGILFGTFINVIIAIVTRTTLVTGASEGVIIKLGFNAGYVHRNYFVYAMIVSFIALFIDQEYGEIRNKNKRLLAFVVFLILLSNSRGGIVVLLTFFFIANFSKIKMSKYKKKIWGIYIALCVMMIIPPLFAFLVSHSENYSFRINGLNNYFRVFQGDWKHLIYGNAEMAFGGRESYDENIKSVIGYDGSTELVLLNVLIKNGLIGLVGYVLVFSRYFMHLKYEQNQKIKEICMAIIIAFLVTSFVEAYIANINFASSVATYVMIVLLEDKAYFHFKRRKNDMEFS